MSGGPRQLFDGVHDSDGMAVDEVVSAETDSHGSRAVRGQGGRRRRVGSHVLSTVHAGRARRRKREIKGVQHGGLAARGDEGLE